MNAPQPRNLPLAPARASRGSPHHPVATNRSGSHIAVSQDRHGCCSPKRCRASPGVMRLCPLPGATPRIGPERREALPILRAMPFPTQPAAEHLTRRDRRMIAVGGTVLLILIAAVAIWALVRPGDYGSSRAGCVTVTLPSSTGGALMHQCGARARAMCRRAFTGSDKVSLLARPQCRLAGLAPAPAPASSS